MTSSTRGPGPQSPPVLVTGGTGTLGRLVVPRLIERGRRVRVLSRHPSADDTTVERATGDLATGAGLAEAMAGIEIVVHCGGTSKGDDAKARTLVAAAPPSVRHLVFISVVGADRVPVKSSIDRGMFGYFAAKREAERVIEQSGLPWTTLRATQFHQSLLALARQLGKLPVIPVVAGMRLQPVDAREVADRLVELVLDAPAGLVPELGGPSVLSMSDLLRGYLRTSGRRRLLLPLHAAGGAARAIRNGANLSPEGERGVISWQHFLAEQEPAAATRHRPGSRPGSEAGPLR